MPNRLFRRRWGKRDEAMSLEAARAIVEAYGQCLETGADPDKIRDAADLPHSKRDIKRAIRIVLDSGPPETLRAALTRDFVRLAQWQDGFAQPVPDAAGVGTAIGDATERAPDVGFTTAYWHERVAHEREALGAELERFGHSPD